MATNLDALQVPVTIETVNDRLYLRAEGRLLAGYIFLGTWRPYFYPLNGPHGNVVRGIDGSEHHNQYGLGLSYGGHGEGGGQNIWSDYDEPPYGPCGKMLHLGFERVVGEVGCGTVVERTLYTRGDGSRLCDEVREMRLTPLPEGELLVEITQTILQRPNDVGPCPFIIAARVADTMRVIHGRRREMLERPGKIENSEGGVGEEETLGKPARWCDYSGVVGDGWGGIALFNHPSNPEHPTAFSTRGYGIFTTKHYFPKEGDSLTLRWGAYVHQGDAKEGKVEERYQRWVKG